MAAIQSLRTALSTLRRNPALFLGGLLYGLIVLPQNALSLANLASVAFLLQMVTFFVTPFVIAGLIGMAGEGLDGDTSLGTLARVGRERYVPLLLGKFVEFGINVLFGVVFVVTALVAIVLGLGLSAGSGVASGGAVLLLGGVFVLLVLAALLVVFFIQFFPVAIAFDGADAVEGFKRSVSLVRSNLLSTLGYSVINFVVSVATTLPVVGFAFYRAFSEGFPDPSSGGPGAGPGPVPGSGAGAGLEMGSLLSTTELVALALVSLALTSLLVAFQQTYATAFYRRHSGTVEDRVLNDAL